MWPHWIECELLEEGKKSAGASNLREDQTCVTLAFMLPIHPTGLPPVSSSKSAMFEEFPDEGERDPAANSRHDGSYTGQNARAEIIPAQHNKFEVRSQCDFCSSQGTHSVPLSPSLLFLDGVVASRVPEPGQLRSNTSMASSNPQYSLHTPCLSKKNSANKR